MKRFLSVFLTALFIFSFTPPSFAGEKESAYDRIMKTRTIRCGYNSYEPVTIRDPNTGVMSGVFPDYMEAIAKVTGLKIEWTSEVGWGEVPIALQSGKIDAMCAGKWADAKDGIQIAYTPPIFFTAIEAYSREGDTRFDKDLSLINDPTVTITGIDGGVTIDIANELFPQAKLLTLPVMDSEADMLMNVSSGKADATFTSNAPAMGFMKNNPGKLHRIAPNSPVRAYGVVLAVDIHEQELLSVLTAATNQLLNNGAIDKILDKYEAQYPESFTRVAKQYVTTK